MATAESWGACPGELKGFADGREGPLKEGAMGDIQTFGLSTWMGDGTHDQGKEDGEAAGIQRQL